MVEGGPDIRAFFIEYVIHRLSENKKYPNMDRGFTRDVVEKVENGALQPDTEDDIATSGSAKPVKTDRGESAILHAA